MAASGSDERGDLWRFAAFRYLPWLAALNMAWEVAQLPLFTLWKQGSAPSIAYAVLHCTAGDVLIGLATFVLAAFLIRAAPGGRSSGNGVVVVAVVLGMAYTVFSEWLNTEVRGAWAYAASMPRVPLIGTGLTPLLQWLLLPPIAYAIAHRFRRGRTASGLPRPFEAVEEHRDGREIDRQQ